MRVAGAGTARGVPSCTEGGYTSCWDIPLALAGDFGHALHCSPKLQA